MTTAIASSTTLDAATTSKIKRSQVSTTASKPKFRRVEPFSPLFRVTQ